MSKDDDLDRENRQILERNKVADPGDIGLIKRVRWRAGANDWYVYTQDDRVYWFSGKREGWKFCPQGVLE